MAEGVLEGLVGGEGEEAEAEASAPALDPAAAAAAMRAAESDPGLAKDAARYFRQQTRFVEIQTEHLHEQRDLNLRHLRWRRWREALQLGLQIFVVLVATALGLGALKMTWDAAHDRSLVVEPFSVPADLQARGDTGQVLAAHLLDKLGEINAKANSTRVATSYAGHWGEEVKVEIPETGVSIADLRRFLERWLGHQTHITGDLVHTPTGLALTVRAGEEPGGTVTGSEADLDGLLQQGAEAAFRQTQPYRYSMYLQETGKLDASLAAARALADSDAPPRERAWALTQVSNLLGPLGDAPGAMNAARQAERFDPTLATTYLNEANAWYLLDREEQGLRATRRAVQLFARPGPDLPTAGSATLRVANLAGLDDLLGDYKAAAEKYAQAATRPDLEGLRSCFGPASAYELARGHDPAASLRALDPRFSDEDGLLRFWDCGELAPVYERAIALQDWTGAADGMRRVIAAIPKTRMVTLYLELRFLAPRLAYALARGGRQAEAEAVAATLPTDCYRCLRTRGWVAATARDWPRADREFAAAVRLAPSLPLAYADWGQSLMARGDLAGAIGKFSAAHDRGPHFADALKFWGDALARQGDWSGALRKYDAALKDAPAWTELHQARNAAAKRVG